MDTTVIHLVILGVISGLTRGAGVLPDGPLKAAVGETVMFTTTLAQTATPFASVVWQFGDIYIVTFTGTTVTAPQYEGRVTFFMSTGSLELRNVTDNDSGEYSVTVITSGGLPAVGTITLGVYVRVSNVKVNTSTTDLVESISSVRLSCSSSGSSLSFLWLNGSSEVTGSDRVQLTDGGSTLTIANVNRYDQGPLRCRVFNPISNGASDAVNFNISYGPDNMALTVNGQDKTSFTTGSNLTMVCSAQSSPPAQLRWAFKGERVNAMGPMLKLFDVREDQSGLYSCLAFNERTHMNSSITRIIEIKSSAETNQRVHVCSLLLLLMVGFLFSSPDVGSFSP